MEKDKKTLRVISHLGLYLRRVSGGAGDRCHHRHTETHTWVHTPKKRGLLAEDSSSTPAPHQCPCLAPDSDHLCFPRSGADPWV